MSKENDVALRIDGLRIELPWQALFGEDFGAPDFNGYGWWDRGILLAAENVPDFAQRLHAVADRLSSAFASGKW